MTERQPNLFNREDTMLGVCEGLGQNFGIPSNLLRLAFAGALFFNPVWTVGVYLALGALIAVTHLFVPIKGVEATAEVEASVPAPVAAHNDVETRELIAA